METDLVSGRGGLRRRLQILHGAGNYQCLATKIQLQNIDILLTSTLGL